MSDANFGIHLSDDLIFASRVSGEARAQGLTVKTARSLEALHALGPATCVIVDLHFPGLDVEQLVAEMKRENATTRIVGYGSHVDAERLKAARTAGCDLVMPRSSFVEQLPVELPRWLDGDSGSGED